MRFFEILMTSGAKLSVFAKGYDQAAEIFTAWFADHYGEPTSYFEVPERNLSWRGLNAEHLRETLALKTSIVGRYDPDKGWTILPTNVPVGES